MKPPQGLEQENGDYRHKESEPRQQPSSNRKKAELVKSLSRNAKPEGILRRRIIHCKC